MLKKLRSKLVITPWIAWLAFLSIILLGGLIAGILVFWKGLGITNLTDLVCPGVYGSQLISRRLLWARAHLVCARQFICSV